MRQPWKYVAVLNQNVYAFVLASSWNLSGPPRKMREKAKVQQQRLSTASTVVSESALSSHQQIRTSFNPWLSI
jgi:hypothetical protein